MALRIAAILLAAGRSLRMGRPKLLLDVGGQAMIRRTAQAVLGIAPVEALVVTGFAAPDIAAALAGLPIRLIHNPRFEEGQPTSVAAGVRALAVACDAVMIVPGDLALLTPVDLAGLVAAFPETGERSILVPYHRGRRGNPILFAAHHCAEVTSGGIRIGCRQLIERHGDKVARVEFESDAYIFDCDTPADYAALLARIEGNRPCSP